MAEYQIFALKVNTLYSTSIYESLKRGIARFGWSYIEDADLNRIKQKVSENGWASLTDDEKNCYQPFLLELKEHDYVVYVNLPKWGECTLARVSGSYYWEKTENDFNHRFSVDPKTVFTFSRNDSSVHPYLSARLKLQGRYWRIYATNEFESLINDIVKGKIGRVASFDSSLSLLSEEIKPHLLEITRRIHHINPNFCLEQLVKHIFQEMPQVLEVKQFHGSSDQGADLLVIYEEGLGIPAMKEQKTCIVQVKSYSGEHWDLRAVNDLRKAFGQFPDAYSGLIISTADKSSPTLDNEIEILQKELNKKIVLLIGEDVATFLLSNASTLLTNRQKHIN